MWSKKIQLIRSALFITLFALISIILTPAQVTQAAADCSAPYAIMPLGDSITQGFASTQGLSDGEQIGYRKSLYDSLTSNGYYVDFVGSKSQGFDFLTDADHEGHPGESTFFFTGVADGATNSRIYDFLTANPPDLILLHIGTNNLNRSNPTADKVAFRVNEMLDEIQAWEDANDPDQSVPIILAQIINRDPPQQMTSDFNFRLEDHTIPRRTGDDITLVDMENDAGLVYDNIAQGGDMWDELHPFSTGYDKMAVVWYNALTPKLTSCISVVSAPVTTARPDVLYTYDVDVTTALPNVTYALEAAPDGMTIDVNTGVINWTPTTSGLFDVIVRATANPGDRTVSNAQSFTIEVEDIEAPVITLIGNAEIDVQANSIFVDPGAMATDNVDGDISSEIVVTGAVNTGILGTYTLDYDVTDAAGNAADTVTRTVNVIDTTPPEITLLGEENVTIEVFDTYSDPGAMATDNYDGDLTDQITITDNLDPATIGTYSIEFSVTDSNDNTASVTRTVNVVDTTAPLISLVGAAEINIEQGDVYSDPGATATDNYDGDISAQIVVDNPVDTSILGTYTVSYDVMDSSDNAADTVTRTVNVVEPGTDTDTTPPVITLNGDAETTVEAGASFVDPGATATDDTDGDISDQIVISGSVDTLTPGTYILSYDVMDSAGNAADTVTRTVNVVDTTPPALTLLGDAEITLTAGSNFTDPGATATDIVDGDLTAAIQVSGIVDTTTPAVYTLDYSVTDSSNNTATATRTVTVIDMNDSSFVVNTNLEYGIVYVDVMWTPVADATYYNLLITDGTSNTLIDTWQEVAGVCDDNNCTFRPGADLLPFGLLNNDYTVTLNAYVNETITEVATTSLTVDIPAPVEPQVTVEPNQGRPTISWTDDLNAMFYQVLIVDAQLEVAYMQWYQRTADLCDGTACSIKPEVYPMAGEYTVYLQPFGPAGFIQNGQQGWVVGQSFTLPDTPPAEPTDMMATDNGDGSTTFTWTGGERTLFYQVWVGTLEPVETYHTLWYLAEDLGCENGGTCTLTPDVTFPAGHTYGWFIQPWGPGGFIDNDIMGWVVAPEFDR